MVIGPITDPDLDQELTDAIAYFRTKGWGGTAGMVARALTELERLRKDRDALDALCLRQQRELNDKKEKEIPCPHCGGMMLVV